MWHAEFGGELNINWSAEPHTATVLAFHRLVDIHAQALFRTAYAMLGRTADAEDVVQETFLAAYRGIGRFEARSSLRTWLTSILMRQVLMLRRKRKGKVMAGLEAAEAEPVAHRTGSERKWMQGWTWCRCWQGSLRSIARYWSCGSLKA